MGNGALQAQVPSAHNTTPTPSHHTLTPHNTNSLAPYRTNTNTQVTAQVASVKQKHHEHPNALDVGNLEAARKEIVALRGLVLMLAGHTGRESD